MPNSRVSTIRAKCYMILEGLENSLCETLKQCLILNEDPSFLTPEEKKRALIRLRTDLEDDWGLDDLYNEDLLSYLDVMDLVQLLNRHRRSLRDVKASHIRRMTEIVQTHSVYAIRNRVMHPLRAIDADNFATLTYVASQLQREAPSLAWQDLAGGVRLADNYERLLNVEIPAYWSEHATESSAVSNNLPAGEFGDSGFIGRELEKRSLKNLIDSYNRVITVIGPGGTGKTALALRVCHELAETSDPIFDRIIWVSLKTKSLTADGIQDITDAISTTESLAKSLAAEVASKSAYQADSIWESVLQEMEKNRTLLIVDNLETLGRDIIELADGIPPNSKLLLTSRKGLGEIERLYRIPELSPVDSGNLMRNLGGAYNCHAIKRLNQDILLKYCENLHHNPLLIKWFVHAVNKGASPSEIFAHNEINEALTFCWQNVYKGLSRSSMRTISILMAARRNLSRSELQELTYKLLNMDQDRFHDTMMELHQTNVIESSIEEDGTEIYQIGSLIQDYLSRNHRPSGGVVRDTRDQLRQLRNEQEARNRRRGVYRYDRDYVHAETRGQQVAARHLDAALRHIKVRNADAAMKSLGVAEEMEPTWWEVHRVKARLLELNLRPTYEIEDAYEESIRYEDNDINRHHYAVHLMQEDEYEKALCQLEAALQHSEAVEMSLRGIRGTILTRQNRYDDAIEDFEYIWQNSDISARLPRYVRKMQGTQFANCRRRQVEQLIDMGKGNDTETHDVAIDCIRIIDQTAEICDWDRQLVEVSIKLLREIHTLASLPALSASAKTKLDGELSLYASKWDADSRFQRCFNDRSVVNTFQWNGVLNPLLPESAKIAHSSQFAKIMKGTVDSIRENFGFINSNEIGLVYMNPSSLRFSHEWSELQEGQVVAFNVELPQRSDLRPRARFLEVDPNL